MTYEKQPEPCQNFLSHAICFLVCSRCWHDYDAHVKKLQEREAESK